MARDYTVGQRLLYAACGIAIVAVSVFVEKHQLISDRGREALLWLLTIPLAALIVFLGRMLIQTWRIPKLDDDTSGISARSDRWIAAQAKVLAKRQRPSVALKEFALPVIICFCVCMFFLWAVLGDARKSGSVGAGDVLGFLCAVLFLVMLLQLIALWRGLRASERYLAKAVMQRSSKAIDP